MNGSGEEVKRVKLDSGTSGQWGEAKRITAHSAPVTVCKYSPDGRYIASGSDDCTIKVWRRDDFSLVQTLRGHEKGINDVSWSPDGDYLASVSDDKSIRIWKLGPQGGIGWTADRPEELRVLRGHTHHITSVSFNFKGNILATGSADESVMTWDVRQGRLMKTLAAHADPVSAVTFSKDGTVLVSSSFDGLIRIWDSRSGHCLKTLAGPDKNPVMHVSFSPNGKFLLSTTLDGTIRLWNILESKCLKTYSSKDLGEFRHSCPSKFIMGQDTSYVIQGGFNSAKIAIWDVQTRELVHQLTHEAQDRPVLGLDVWDHDILSGGFDGQLVLFQPSQH
uniref:ARAD1B08624p n=1 Tax=Blastobotrys adeninivorans TaxID=409370 RepID=A0A060T584_BLAAD